MDVYAGFSQRPLAWRWSVAGVVSLLLLVACLVYPGHATAFLNRLLLGSAHYPTATRIDRIAINGQQVVPALADHPLRIPLGQPLSIEVTTSGVTPVATRVEFTDDNALNSVLPLTATASSNEAFSGKLPRLLQRVTYQVFADDAWTEPAIVDVVALPLVTLELTADPPSYAAITAPPPAKSNGARQLAVIEGTRVHFTARCSNKSLASAVLSVDKQAFPLTSQDAMGQHWILAESGTPLASIAAPLRYSLQVTDTDGLQLPEPLVGFIRMSPDRPPRVRATMTTIHVLPSATPKLRYEASDDFGVAGLRLHRETVPQQGEPQKDIINVPVQSLPLISATGVWPVDLSSLRLKKGDQVKLTLEAIDFRGTDQGKSAFSDPLVLNVTDERGVLANMAESDEQSAKQLDAIIQRQLGIGGSE